MSYKERLEEYLSRFSGLKVSLIERPNYKDPISKKLFFVFRLLGIPFYSEQVSDCILASDLLAFGKNACLRAKKRAVTVLKNNMMVVSHKS